MHVRTFVHASGGESNQKIEKKNSRIHVRLFIHVFGGEQNKKKKIPECTNVHSGVEKKKTYKNACTTSVHAFTAIRTSTFVWL